MMENRLSAVEVSEKLGVNIKTLYRWRYKQRRDGENVFSGKGNLTPVDAELRKMRRRIKDLEEENEILKKATALAACQTSAGARACHWSNPPSTPNARKQLYSKDREKVQSNYQF